MTTPNATCPNPTPNAPMWMVRLAQFGIVANSLVFIVVNYWIYRARYLFIDTHPNYVAVKPPTISRAISDNLIGDPFAFWITASAILLSLAMFPIAALYYRARQATQGVSQKVDWYVRYLAPVGVSCQFVAAIGMYMLSSFRFPDHRDLHMVGSYLFFSFEALTVIFSALACWQLTRNPAVIARLENDWSVSPRMSAFRWRLAAFSAMTVVGYITLFVLKDFDLPFGNHVIYASYVMLEPAVITVFLTYLLSFNIDMGRILIKFRP